MDWLFLIGIVIVSKLITFVVVCCYIKFLALIASKLRQTLYKVGEPRSNARQDSCLENCCIKCFDKAHYFLYTYVRFIGRTVKNLIRYKYIGENSHNAKEKCGNKYRNGYVKGSLPFGFHRRIISKLRGGHQPNANKTI